jgi:hypothetical protein
MLFRIYSANIDETLLIPVYVFLFFRNIQFFIQDHWYICTRNTFPFSNDSSGLPHFFGWLGSRQVATEDAVAT